MQDISVMIARISELSGGKFKYVPHGDLTDEDRLRIAQAKADKYNSGRGNLPDYDCNVCLNKGDIARVSFDNRFKIIREYNVECKCMNVRRAIWKMKASGLEESVKRCRFDNFEALEQWQKDLLQMAKDYAENPEGWLFVGGQVGSGKTHICTAVCRELLHKGMAVVYMPWQTDVTTLKAISMDSDEYTFHMDAVKTAEVLYIDDFFKPVAGQEPSAADVRIAYEIINYRYINRLPTIISSERKILELVQIDEATGSRIYEMSKAHNMSIKRDPARDYRLKGAVER